MSNVAIWTVEIAVRIYLWSRQSVESIFRVKTFSYSDSPLGLITCQGETQKLNSQTVLQTNYMQLITLLAKLLLPWNLVKNQIQDFPGLLTFYSNGIYKHTGRSVIKSMNKRRTTTPSISWLLDNKGAPHYKSHQTQHCKTSSSNCINYSRVWNRIKPFQIQNS